MADNHQCPFCELIFLNIYELQAHIASDHPDRQVPEREYSLPPAGPWPSRNT